MNRNVGLAVLGLFLLLPAIVLVSTDLLEVDRPDALVHPVLVMGGIFLAIALNLIPVPKLSMGYEEGTLSGTMALRLRGTGLNLIALIFGGLLVTAITTYLFFENVQPITRLAGF